MCRKNDKLTFHTGFPSSATEDIKSKIGFWSGFQITQLVHYCFFKKTIFSGKRFTQKSYGLKNGQKKGVNFGRWGSGLGKLLQ